MCACARAWYLQIVETYIRTHTVGIAQIPSNACACEPVESHNNNVATTPHKPATNKAKPNVNMSCRPTLSDTDTNENTESEIWPGCI